VELVVVAAIIGLLLALIMPALSAARESARRTQCAANLRQIGIGLQIYHAAFRSFPAGCLGVRTVRIAWSAFLLPFVDQIAVYERLDLTTPYNSPRNLQAGAVPLSIYLCPSTSRLGPGRRGLVTGDSGGRIRPGDGLAVTDYGGLFGAARVQPLGNGVMLYDRWIRLDQVRDGTSHTIVVAEDTGRGRTWDGEWINGENIFDRQEPINRIQHNELWSDHPGGCQAVFCDGSVRFLSESSEAALLDALATRDAGDLAAQAAKPD
jgi:prepilin-type processing-associated H-X9-DG protein